MKTIALIWILGCTSIVSGDENAPLMPKVGGGTEVSDMLKAMKEVSLYQRLADPIDEYRFTYQPSFHNEISVRITKAAGKISLRAVMLSRRKIVDERKRELTPKEWTEFQTALARTGFWQIDPPEPGAGFDGATWIFEGAGNFRYRMISLWSPLHGEAKSTRAAFGELGKYLVELSGIKPDKPLY